MSIKIAERKQTNKYLNSVGAIIKACISVSNNFYLKSVITTINDIFLYFEFFKFYYNFSII